MHNPFIIRYCGDLTIHLKFVGQNEQGDRAKYIGYIEGGGHRWNFSNLCSGAGKITPTAERYDEMAAAAVSFGANPEGEATEASDYISNHAETNDRGNIIRREQEGPVTYSG